MEKVNFRKLFTLSFLWLLVVGVARSAEQDSTVFTIDFPVGRTVVQEDLYNNGTTLRLITETLTELQADSVRRIVGVTFRGNASPEGSAQINRKLSHGRMKVLEQYVRSRIAIPDSIVSEEDGYVAWDQVISLLENSDYTWKEDALQIARSPERTVRINSRDYDTRVIALRRLRGGRVWPVLFRDVFGRVRNASAVIITHEPVLVEPEPIVTVEQEPEPTPEPVDSVEPQPEVQPIPAPVALISPCDQKHWYLKTNAIGWAMLASNVAVELETGCRWSVTLPVYFSALNYFKRTLKFRGIVVQPELRYWFTGAPQQGWFAGAHLGLGWWNYATCGDYRYQDHNGTTPSWGGGVSVGYRLPIAKRWRFEATVGGGVYDVKYDKFINRGNGPKVERNIHRTWVGLDNVAATFIYSFDINRNNTEK